MARIATLALGVMTVALAGTVALELRPSRKQASTLAAAAPPDPAVDAKTPLLVDHNGQAWVQVALARPLFTQSRRPSAVARASQAQAAPAKLPRLAGIMMDGSRRSVIFAASGDRKPISVTEGGEFDGYKVEHIEAGMVTVSGAGQRQILRPSFDLNAAPPPPPAQAPLQVPVLPGNIGAQGYGGPPGLERMVARMGQGAGPGPGQGQNPNQAPSTPGLPGLPNLDNLTGVPGLSVPGTAPAQ